MSGLDQLGRAGEMLAEQHAAATDEDHRGRFRRRLHPVHRLGDRLLDPVQTTSDQVGVEPGNALRIADHGSFPGHRQISGRHGVAAEDPRPVGQLVADTVRPDGYPGPVPHQAASAQPERVHVRHPEVGPHSADLDRR